MADWVRIDDVVGTLTGYLDEFNEIVQVASSAEFFERLKRWRRRVAKYLRDNVSDKEADRLARISMRSNTYAPGSFQHMLDSHRSFIAVLVQELMTNPTAYFEQGTVVSTPGNVDEIFLSHAVADKPIATVLRNQIMDRKPGVQIFLSSRPGHIPSGRQWWSIIQSRLRSAGAYVILLTERSVNRPWIAFEAGAAWMSGRSIYTVSAGRLRKSSIPMPFSAFQIDSIDDADEAKAFLQHVGANADDIESFSAAVGDAVVSLETEPGADDWVGVQVGNRYFAWDGNGLHALEDRRPIQTPPGLLEAITAAGLNPGYGRRDRLEQQFRRGLFQVFETDKQSWRREVRGVGGEQVLLVRPSGKT